MDVRYEFTVPGTPVPQGSMSVFNGRIVHQKGKQLTAWRSAIYEECRAIMEPLEGPVRVRVTFMLQEPKTTMRALPHVRPDVDKLARAALDGLTGAAFADDCQVVDLRVKKVYGAPGAAFIIEGFRDETLFI